MTDQEKKQIVICRNQGLGYMTISKMLGISVNSIKTYCRRNGLGGVRVFENAEAAKVTSCENCGTPLKQNPGRKKKRFCSDRCRNKWWNTHLDQVKRKANYEYVCPVCEKFFTVYGNSKRKYCSHECYIKDRFGGVADV